MAKIHIVGEKDSFTYKACNNRYADGFEFEGHAHDDLVESLLSGKIPRTETSIVPLWNSNAGTINMDRKTPTTKIFLGQAGRIADMWPEEITFELGVRGNGELADGCDIYSVRVANDQCSKFLKKVSVYNTDRFKGEKTTTNAANAFRGAAKDGDGLLCSTELLKSESLAAKGNCANPFNMTVFSTINSLPVNKTKKSWVYSLACVLVYLEGDKLPYDFIDYWKTLLPEHEAETSKDLLLTIPKILFIIRHESSKALLLLQKPSSDFSENPWPIPNIDTDISVDRNSDIVSCEQVGGMYESYIETERKLFLANFKQKGEDIIFYGADGAFLWGSPVLNIFVHGFDFKLVKECARMQVSRLRDLINYNIPVPQEVDEMVKKFETEENSLRLGPDSAPDIA